MTGQLRTVALERLKERFGKSELVPLRWGWRLKVPLQLTRWDDDAAILLGEAIRDERHDEERERRLSAQSTRPANLAPTNSDANEGALPIRAGAIFNELYPEVQEAWDNDPEVQEEGRVAAERIIAAARQNREGFAALGLPSGGLDELERAGRIANVTDIGNQTAGELLGECEIAAERVKWHARLLADVNRGQQSPAPPAPVVVVRGYLDLDINERERTVSRPAVSDISRVVSETELKLVVAMTKAGSEGITSDAAANLHAGSVDALDQFKSELKSKLSVLKITMPRGRWKLIESQVPK